MGKKDCVYSSCLAAAMERAVDRSTVPFGEHSSSWRDVEGDGVRPTVVGAGDF